MKLFQFKRIGDRILAAFFLVALVSLSLLGVGSYFYVEEILKETYLQRLQIIANGKHDNFKSFFIDQQTNISVAANNPSVIQAAREYNDRFRHYGVDSVQFAEIDKKLRRFLTYIQERHEFKDLFLISPSGDIVFSVLRETDFATNLNTGPWRNTQLAVVFRNASSLISAEISEFRFYPPSNEEAAFMAAPLLDGSGENSKYVGVIAIQLNTRQIDELAVDYQGLGNSGEIVLAANINGIPTVIAPLRHEPDAAFRMTFPTDAEQGLPILIALNGQEGIGAAIDYRGEDVIAVWNALPYPRWGMVVKVDSSEVFEPVDRLQRWLLGIFLLIILIAVYFAKRFSNVVSDPVIKLAEATRKFARGEISEDLPVSSRDEIGELTDSFNQMRQSLFTAEQELLEANALLEQRVKDRTAELESAQARIVQTEKLSALGTLVAGVAHELNNPLMGIMNYLEYAETHASEPRVRQVLEKSRRETDRLKLIVNNMLLFVSDQGKKLESVSVKQTIHAVLELLKTDLRHQGIQVETDIPEQLPRVLSLPGGLQQCLLNLLLNARDALLDEEQKQISIQVYCRGEYLFIEIKDNGKGIPANIRHRIFDPFFTTKAADQGTGLGLSVSRQFIENAGGVLSEEEHEGRGALFSIRLNLA